MWQILEWLTLGIFVAAMAHVCLYGLHRYILLYLYWKHARNRPQVNHRFETLPRVTVQLPMYNERYVARRIIEESCKIDYPKDRLQIQVLDDSTDDTCAIAEETVQRMRQAGCDIEYIHRENRVGYKAGALEEGTTSATGELLAIFDADFIPHPKLLKETVHYFTDADVGMVQARWDHINRDDSVLTGVQAVMLDGHFVMEHGARCRSGRFMSFNGTAGVWRKTCITDAGGWQHDTLTEDLDLSYRAQMKGWKFVFLPDIACPAELPPVMESFKTQQHRWAKGGAQTCRKLLPTIMRSKQPARVKLEAFFHLTSCTVYPTMVVIVLLLGPTLWCSYTHRWAGPTALTWLVDIGLLMVATCSVSAFYAFSQRELSRSWYESLKWLPFLMSVGVGISLNNARATVAGFLGHESEFVRTPKLGVEGSGVDQRRRRRGSYAWSGFKLQPYAELAIGLYLVGSLALCIHARWVMVGMPFMALFAAGYLYVALNSLWNLRSRPAPGDATLARQMPMPLDRPALPPEHPASTARRGLQRQRPRSAAAGGRERSTAGQSAHRG